MGPFRSTPSLFTSGGGPDTTTVEGHTVGVHSYFTAGLIAYALALSCFSLVGWAVWPQRVQRVRQQLENALQEETRKYQVADLFSNAADLTTIQTDVEKKLSDRLSSALGQSFFCGPTYELGRDCSSPTFVIKKIDLPPDVVKAFQDNRTSQIQVQTAQNQIAQRQAEAQAIEEIDSMMKLAGNIMSRTRLLRTKVPKTRR
jgi:regulator of protease activity HflC (stomatin/prohibitin superfamily)